LNKNCFKYNSPLFACIFILCLISCAQKATLTGGPKDEIGPTITTSNPTLNATNVAIKKFTFEFDEFIEASSLKSKLIISPSPKKKPDIEISSKKVNISLKDSLLPNTTYILQFNQSIKDITESNPIAEVPFVFSTGAHIDSNSISGTVINAKTLEPVNQCWVMAYKTTDNAISQDSLLKGYPADYIVSTNASGIFSISFMAPGSYHLFALAEQDRNFKYNAQVEQIGFSSTLTQSNDTTQKTIKLKVFNAFQEMPWSIKEYKATQYGTVELFFTDTVDSFIPLNLLETQYEYTTYNKDSMVSMTLLDTSIINHPVTLITKTNEHTDTTKRIVLNKTAVEPLNMSIKEKEVSPFSRPNFLCNQPIKDIDTSLITLSIDSMNIPFQYKYNANKKGLSISDSLYTDSLYSITFLPKSITSYYHKTNEDTLTYSFSIINKNKYANLIINIDDSLQLVKGAKIISLEDQQSKNTIVKYKKENTFTFKNLPEGSYKLQLTLDKNENNRWDTGDFSKGIQPEKIVLYEGTIEMKSGFEQEITWKLK